MDRSEAHKKTDIIPMRDSSPSRAILPSSHIEASLRESLSLDRLLVSRHFLHTLPQDLVCNLPRELQLMNEGCTRASRHRSESIPHHIDQLVFVAQDSVHVGRRLPVSKSLLGCNLRETLQESARRALVPSGSEVLYVSPWGANERQLDRD
jgi:hypothetical protein